ncbi:TetR/AcrR family transcriptional regulator [Caulobacter sp. X]|uniref:TetR/AcrR family transcriptional regulator n=1 Tax=Caulobacter sp. X TaxID=2048901 RepID=UPI000C15C3B0|nr:TetR/AcrR family transcriptional regulator [Caulobacter sp. X]PIC00998.1 TetR family transcriptional regulator [Caulobacter sp. X]
MKATLKDIVIEARELFRRHGYDGASMQELAERVGLKKASLYTRFPNKEALAPEVLKLTLAEASSGLADDVDWRARYAAVLTRFAETLIEGKRCVGLHLAYGVSNDTPLAQAAVRDFFKVQREGLAAILTSGGMPAGQADATAADAIARLEGATLWLATMNDEAPMRRALAELIAAQA